MQRFHVLPLPGLDQLLKDHDMPIALNDSGELLCSHSSQGLSQSSNDICGIRYHLPSARYRLLRYPQTMNILSPDVTSINNAGEVVGGYRATAAFEGSYGLYWNAAGQIHSLGTGSAIVINDQGQVLSDDTHFTDGQTYGGYSVSLRPGAKHASAGALEIGRVFSYNKPIVASHMNNRGEVVGLDGGIVLWQPGQYSDGKVIEVSNRDNAGTPFTCGEGSVMITDDGVVVHRGYACTGPPESLRFHRWRRGVTTTAVPLRLPKDSLLRGAQANSLLRTVSANARGEVLLQLECGKDSEPLLWREGIGFERLPGITAGLLLNNHGWILGTMQGTNGASRRYGLLRPYR